MYTSQLCLLCLHSQGDSPYVLLLLYKLNQGQAIKRRICYTQTPVRPMTEMFCLQHDMDRPKYL